MTKLIKKRALKKSKIDLLIKRIFSTKTLSKKKVLWLEWFTEGREIEQTKHLITFLKDILGWEVDFVSQFNPINCFGKYYDLAIMSGISGSRLGIEWANIIYKKSKIPLFISETEGIYQENNIEEFVWGHLKNNKEILWTKCGVWNKESIRLIKKYYPEFINSFFLSGSLGIDRYKISNNSDKLGNNFDFGIALNDHLTTYRSIKKCSKKNAEFWFNNTQKNANILLIKYIKKLIDKEYKILIKPHPGMNKNESHPVLKFFNNSNNIKILSKNDSISEAIIDSKIWVVQNSTSAIEALARNKPVFKIGNYYPPFEGYQSLPSFEKINKQIKHKSIDKLIRNYKSTYNLNIKKFVGFDDGLNHLRFTKVILNYFEVNKSYKPRKINMNFYFLFKKTFIYFLLKFLIKIKININDQFQKRYILFNEKKLNLLLFECSKNLMNFYEKRIDIIEKIFL